MTNKLMVGYARVNVTPMLGIRIPTNMPKPEEMAEAARMVLLEHGPEYYEMPLTAVALGYFPMQEAYDEGGYEARASKLKAGVAELIIAEGTKLLGELR